MMGQDLIQELNKELNHPKNATQALWEVEFRNAFKSTEPLAHYLAVSLPQSKYPLFIPQGLAENIKKKGPASALWKQFVPDKNEDDQQAQDLGLNDPIGDQVHWQKEHQLIHRYKNRVLFLPTSKCPVACRYCFRKNEIHFDDDLFSGQFEKTLQYLQQHPEVEEVIFTGGDPFILSNKKIDFYLSNFVSIPHIQYIRFHTRTPIILPSRIEDELLEILAKYQKHFEQIIVAIHCNHPDELNLENKLAIQALKESGVTLLSQTVLMKEINNQVDVLNTLMRKFVTLGIRPYYLHHPDRVRGAMHFYLTPEEGQKLYQQLRYQVPGHFLPMYVIDNPDGSGKKTL